MSARSGLLTRPASEGGVLLPVPEVSIVVPAYNEANRLPRSLSAIYSHLSRAQYTAEVIVVDDGSTDGTAALVSAAACNFPGLRLLENHRNYGKGYSVRRGVLQSQGRYILFTDADLSTPIQEADRLLALLQQGWDIVLGSRALDPRLLQKPQPWLRRQAGNLFHRMVRNLMRLPFRDTQCGFKAFRRPAAIQLFQLQRIDRFGFDVEVLWLARHLGLECLEVGVVWVNNPNSHVSLLRDGPRMMLDLLQIHWRGWKGTYDQAWYLTASAPR